MKTPIVTIDLERYNELLEIEKDSMRNFKIFIIHSYNSYKFGWNDSKCVYVETDSEGIQKLNDEFEKSICEYKKEIERFKLFEIKNYERYENMKFNSMKGMLR